VDKEAVGSYLQKASIEGTLIYSMEEAQNKRGYIQGLQEGIIQATHGNNSTGKAIQTIHKNRQ